MSKCHDCGHTWKHHKVAGRCRKGCDCDKAGRKVKVRGRL